MGHAGHHMYARYASIVPSKSSRSTPYASLSATDVGWQSLGPAVAFTTVATLIVSMRWYTRGVLLRCVGREDGIITISMVRWSSEAGQRAQHLRSLHCFSAYEFMHRCLALRCSLLWLFVSFHYRLHCKTECWCCVV
jgi:hypothetical protein